MHTSSHDDNDQTVDKDTHIRPVPTHARPTRVWHTITCTPRLDPSATWPRGHVDAPPAFGRTPPPRLVDTASLVDAAACALVSGASAPMHCPLHRCTAHCVARASRRLDERTAAGGRRHSAPPRPRSILRPKGHAQAGAQARPTVRTRQGELQEAEQRSKKVGGWRGRREEKPTESARWRSISSMTIGEGSAVSESVSRPEGPRRSSILMDPCGGRRRS